MPSLPELQHRFALGVFQGDTSVLEWIEVPESRFDIYRSSVLANLRSSLRAVYPVVQRLTGEAFFEQAAGIFARESPSRSGDLHRYGEEFPEFLARYAPAHSLVYLRDVAHLEWCWHRAFHSANPRTLDLAALSRVPPADYGRLRFDLQPGCKLLRSAYPVLRIWESNRYADIVAQEIDLAEGADYLMIYRAGFDVAVTRLSIAEQAFVEALDRGEMFGAAIDLAIDVAPDFNADAALQRLAGAGIIQGFGFGALP